MLLFYGLGLFGWLVGCFFPKRFGLVLGSSLTNIIDFDQEKEIALAYQTDKCLC